MLKRRILTLAIDKYGLPWNYLIKLHINSSSECQKLLRQLGKALEIHVESEKGD